MVFMVRYTLTVHVESGVPEDMRRRQFTNFVRVWRMPDGYEDRIEAPLDGFDGTVSFDLDAGHYSVEAFNNGDRLSYVASKKIRLNGRTKVMLRTELTVL